MARKVDNKELSVEQETDLARRYAGRRSPSSGAQPGDHADMKHDLARTDGVFQLFEYAAECKATRAKAFPLKKETWDKIKQEAQEMGRRPEMFIRFYDEFTGESFDLVIRDVNDDLEMWE